jgi:spermidine synthase
MPTRGRPLGAAENEPTPEREDPRVSARFEQLDCRPTAIGEISLRRRLEPSLQVDVYEVKLGDEFLMSSLFTVAEVELARLGLADVPGSDLDVVVGGLGLGYTARAVLQDRRVRSLHVVETLGEVIEWHRRRLVPLGAELTSDPRCHLVHGDFFAMVERGSDFGSGAPQRCHAVLVDIDHTPRHLLHPSHAPFYEPEGLRRLADRLHPAGVFGLWSDAPPDHEFVAAVEQVFASCDAHVVSFPNPHTGGHGSSTVYIAKR